MSEKPHPQKSSMIIIFPWVSLEEFLIKLEIEKLNKWWFHSICLLQHLKIRFPVWYDFFVITISSLIGFLIVDMTETHPKNLCDNDIFFDTLIKLEIEN